MERKCYCSSCDKIVEMPVVILTNQAGYEYQAYEHRCSPDTIIHLDKQLEDLNPPEVMQLAAQAGKQMAEILSEFYHGLEEA